MMMLKLLLVVVQLWCVRRGGLVVRALFADQAVKVRALAGNTALCSCARHFTFSVPPSTQVFKWALAKLILWITLRWINTPSRGEKKCS